MSSFANIRESRQSKESKSYVQSTASTQASSSTSSSQPSSVEGKDTKDLDEIKDTGEIIYSLPPNIEIRNSDSKGRGLWSKIHYKPGNTLLATKPHIAVLSNQHLDSYCSNCFGPSPASGLKRCTTCRTVWYCDSECQNKDWPLHKRECSALQEWVKAAPSPDLALPSDAVRCLGRLMWTRQKKGSSSRWTKEIDAMQSHRQSLQSSSFELHAHLSHALVRYLGISCPEQLSKFELNSPKDLVDIISRFITNTFSVTTPTLTPIGASVSPIVALINHSCEPNVVVVFPRSSASSPALEPLMQIIALRNIEPNEEILTSYIDTTLPRYLRQKSLKETYNFECTCTLCTSSADVDPREAVFCPKKCGGTCPVPLEESSLCLCLKCRTILKDTGAVIDAARVGQEGLDKAVSLQFKDPTKSLQLAINLIPILISSGLTPSSHPLLALSRLHQSLLIDSLPSPLTQESLDDAIRATTRSSTAISTILPYGHPIRGITLAELGKLLAVDEPSPHQPSSPAEAALIYPPSGSARLKLALETTLRARNELLVGFGGWNEGGQAGKDIRELIVALEKEMAVWKQGVDNVLKDTPRPVAFKS
ncbi:hypothetical protein C0995_008163 [Termitomyces sp. Mi166|nr:hypothetical protein C0995_008163 [Termitomyces sp. Mi166\